MEDNGNIVSIIIPAFNAGKFLEETVVSAMSSNYPFFEVIIVNDGSTDDTNLVIEKIKKQYPQIRTYEQENSGVAVARNLAIKNAIGKYILPLDADDLITPDYIEKAVEILDADEHVKVVYCMAEFFGDKTGLFKLPAFKRKLLARKNLIFVSGLYRKSDYEKTDGYRSEIKGPEDWDFWISLLKNGGEVVRIPKVCFYYRVHENSKRVATRSKKKEGIDIINKRHKAFIHASLGGRLHYVRQMSEFINFFQGFFCSVRVVLTPGYESYNDIMYDIPELFREADGGDIRVVNYGDRVLRIECFRGRGLRRYASRKYRLACGADEFRVLGYYERISGIIVYEGYFVEIK